VVGGGASVTLPSTMDISRAVNFLVTQQDADGSFGAPLYTDWVALALYAA